MPKDNKKITRLYLRLGCMSGSIGEQLKRQGFKAIDPKDARIWERAAESLNFLLLHGYIALGHAVASRQKLVHQISKAVRPLRKPRATVKCKRCGKQTPAATAHRHSRGYICDAGCWDDRLKTTE